MVDYCGDCKIVREPDIFDPSKCISRLFNPAILQLKLNSDNSAGWINQSLLQAVLAVNNMKLFKEWAVLECYLSVYPLYWQFVLANFIETYLIW